MAKVLETSPRYFGVADIMDMVMGVLMLLIFKMQKIVRAMLMRELLV